MATNNPNIQQRSTQQQPIIFQQVSPSSLQVSKSKKNIPVKSLSWSKSSETPFQTQGRTVDIEAQAKALFTEVKENLSNLRQLHNALMTAEYLNIHYKSKHKNKTEEYQKLLNSINELSRNDVDQKTIKELKIISDALTFDRANIDAIFPKIIAFYNSIYLDNSMENKVKQIGYEDFHADALAALNQMNALESVLEEENKETTDGKMTIQRAIQIINTANDMQENVQRILALKAQSLERAKKTTINVLTGVATTILSFGILVFILYKQGVEWETVRDYPIIGIPLGIGIWSFIGSFAAMLTQFYKKPVYDFGNTLKWVIIRPVLGVVMGAAIYLALFSLVLTGKNQNELLPLLVAFFVGYSDTFTFDILNSTQRVIANLFSNPSEDSIKNNPAQPVYVVAPNNTQATPVVPSATATTTNTNSAAITTADNIPTPMDDNHLLGLNEDEK
ncbi:hypothetical protein [Aureispira anguillae]|uniref:Uncharacterized protein n=1 Tax=Aureispira anguillae TaxID=2864201 RepID=A0A915YGF8_9BACT|nr:hypothetical protein [Aureispira anguillae]BDS12559.1 hypothetical protein AsAng_0032820 [Aureispira anguillae]